MVDQHQFARVQRSQGPFQGGLQLLGVFYPLPVAAKGFDQLGIVGAGDIYSIVDSRSDTPATFQNALHGNQR